MDAGLFAAPAVLGGPCSGPTATTCSTGLASKGPWTQVGQRELDDDRVPGVISWSGGGCGVGQTLGPLLMKVTP